MTVIHIVTANIFPEPGGMEQSVLRIAKSLAQSADRRIVVYTRRQSEAYCRADPSHAGIEIVHLSRDKSFLMEPLESGAGPPIERIPNVYALESMRIDFLLLRAAVEARMNAAPHARHVMVSFYVTNTGFVTQHVALALDIPHIASFRGSDFSRDFRSPYHLPAIQFVVENAARIVATNDEQACMLGAAFPGARTFQVIHGAIELDESSPTWTPGPPDIVRMIGDCEFSMKKGTHILLQATGELLAQGMPIALTIAGRVVAEEKAYWERSIAEWTARFPGAFEFPGWLPLERLNTMLRTSHIYVSATLGEGCSLAHAGALALGIPMVATNTGALPQLCRNASHVRLCAAGSVSQFREELRAMIEDVQRGCIHVDYKLMLTCRRHFAPDRERKQWEQAIAEV